MTDWWAFVTRYMALRELKASQVAERARFNKSRMTSWSDGAAPTPKLARDTALALDAPILEAFVAAGFLEPGDTDRIIAVDRPPAALTDDELLAEVARRMRSRSSADDAELRPAGLDVDELAAGAAAELEVDRTADYGKQSG